MAKVYYLRDIRLIKNSKIIHEHTLLANLFEKYPDLDEIQLKDLSKEEQLFLNNIYPKVKMEAIKEWKVDYSKGVEVLDEHKTIKCQLCNHNIMNLCYIKNKFNNNSLKVGTECVRHFEIKEDVDLDKILQERKYIKRLEKLNFKVPNIETIANQWDLIIEQQPIYIKKSIKSNYLNIGNKIKELYREYTYKKNITLSRETEIIQTINKLIELSQKEKQAILEYVNDNKHNILVPTKEIIINLKKENNSQGLKWIEEDGEIKNRTLFRIKDIEYIKKLIPYFSKALSKSGIMIKYVETYKNKLGYTFTVKRNPNIKLFLHYTDFVIDYGGIVTKEQLFSDINQFEFIRKGKLIDIESINFGLGLIEEELKKYSIKYKEFYDSFNDMLWVKEKGNKRYYYILTKLDGLYDLIKRVIYKTEKYNSKDLYDIIMKNSEILKNSDAKELIYTRDKMII